MRQGKNALVEFLYKITRSRHVIIWLLLHHGRILLRRGMLLLTMMSGESCCQILTEGLRRNGLGDRGD